MCVFACICAYKYIYYIIIYLYRKICFLGYTICVLTDYQYFM